MTWGQKFRLTPDPDWPPTGFCVFSGIRIWCQKYVKNRTPIRSHFSISAMAGVCVVISLSKSMGKSELDRRLQPDSEQESHSKIWISARAGSGFKNFGTGVESESEKVTPATSEPQMITEPGSSEISDLLLFAILLLRVKEERLSITFLMCVV